MNHLKRVYDNLDLTALETLLMFDGCENALRSAGGLYYIEVRGAPNLLARDPSSLEWMHTLTIPLWNTLMSELDAQWSELAIKHVAAVLYKKAVNVEMDMVSLLQGFTFECSGSGSIFDGLYLPH